MKFEVTTYYIIPYNTIIDFTYDLNIGATILYATHIFDGLDDWPTHLHYLTNDHTTGWQGKIEDLQIYSELRAKGEPSPLLYTFFSITT